MRYNYKDFLGENDTFRYSKDILETSPKLVYRQTSSNLISTIDFDRLHTDKTIHCIVPKDNNIIDLKFLMTNFNSKLFNYIYNLFSEEEGRTFAQVKTINVKKLPIKEISKIEQEPFIAKANKMLELNKKLQETKQNFTNELKLEKLPIKLQKFEELDFDDFVKEYVKAKKIKLADQLEERNFKNNWLAIFENDKKEVLELQNQIKIIDKEIDRMVYKLYDLNEDEIKIVEDI